MPKNSLSCKNLFLKHRRQQKHVVTYMATNSTGNKVLITPYWTYIILMLLWYSSCNEICIILGSLDLRVLIGKKQAAKEKWQSHNHCNTRYRNFLDLGFFHKTYFDQIILAHCNHAKINPWKFHLISINLTWA